MISWLKNAYILLKKTSQDMWSEILNKFRKVYDIFK